jgi:hypothetical protein
MATVRERILILSGSVLMVWRIRGVCLACDIVILEWLKMVAVSCGERYD